MAEINISGTESAIATSHRNLDSKSNPENCKCILYSNLCFKRTLIRPSLVTILHWIDCFDLTKSEYWLIIEKIPLLSLIDCIWKVEYFQHAIFYHMLWEFILIALNWYLSLMVFGGDSIGFGTLKRFTGLHHLTFLLQSPRFVLSKVEWPILPSFNQLGTPQEIFPRILYPGST